MCNLMANSVFWANRREYRPGDTVPANLPGVKDLLAKGFVVYRDGRKAAKAAEQAAGEAEEGNVPEQETDEVADGDESGEAAVGDKSSESEEKSANGRKKGTDK